MYRGGWYALRMARIQERGQITLPKAMREEVGLAPGDEVTITVDGDRLVKAAGKKYEPVTYDGATHGFMRAGEAPDATEANKKAREEAWKRWKSLLAQ